MIHIRYQAHSSDLSPSLSRVRETLALKAEHVSLPSTGSQESPNIVSVSDSRPWSSDCTQNWKALLKITSFSQMAWLLHDFSEEELWTYQCFPRLEEIKGIVHPKMCICWKFTHPQNIQDVDEFAWNVALHHLLTSGSSAVNGCRQNESPNSW